MSPAVLEEPSAPVKTQFTLPLTRFQQALATVSLAIARKTTIPILSSVSVEQHEDHLDFSGTNLELSARCRIPLSGDKHPAFLLPGLKLESFAKLLQGETVKITRYDDRRAALFCGRSTTRLPLQSAASFPRIELSDGNGGISLDREAAERLLRFTSFAISQDEARYTLAGGLLEISGGRLTLTTTDGHRLAQYSIPTDEMDRPHILIPLGIVTAIEKALALGGSSLVLEGDEKNVYADMPGDGFSIALSHRGMTGKFPNYKAVMPTTFVATVTVDAETMLRAVKRTSMFSDERSGAVVLTVSPEFLVLRGACVDTGESEEMIDAKIEGDFDDRFIIGFNADYLLDVFSRLKGDVTIRFSGARGESSVLISAEPETGETFSYVLMPMRV